MIYVWGIALAILVTALLSATEMAFIAANRVRIRHLAESGNATASRYLEAFRHPERMLSAAMMGVTVAHITASSLATRPSCSVLAGGRPPPPPSSSSPSCRLRQVIPKVASEWAIALLLRLYRALITPSSSPDGRASS
jgi:CBS domain containing-hemolysin-like protein